MIDVEQLREYCLSLGNDIEEKMPFANFHGASTVLVFYVCGHMFCYFDIEQLDIVTVKCQPDRIAELRARHEWITSPYNSSPLHWIGISIQSSDPQITRDLILNSYHLVKAKYTPKSRGKHSSTDR